jgi:hypothetical protein
LLRDIENHHQICRGYYTIGGDWWRDPIFHELHTLFLKIDAPNRAQ